MGARRRTDRQTHLGFSVKWYYSNRHKISVFTRFSFSLYTEQVQRHNIVILTGTKSDTHMKQDLNILQWKLEDPEIKEMDRLI